VWVLCENLVVESCIQNNMESVLTCEEDVWGVSVRSGVEKVTEGWYGGEVWVECPLSGLRWAIASNVMFGLTVHLSLIWLFFRVSM
jgi:hypothetical protein